MFLMSVILPDIRRLSVNELGDIGNSEIEQNEAIFSFTNIVLDKRARQAYIEEFSDALNITADGDYTFLLSGVAITDLYEPLAVHVTNKYGKPIQTRTAFDAPTGWRRESNNQPVNIRGVTGLHVLKYLRYPAQITASTDPVEFPRAAKWDLIFDVVGMVKQVKNYYDEATAMRNLATGTATVKASISSRGSNSGPPSILDKET